MPNSPLQTLLKVHDVRKEESREMEGGGGVLSGGGLRRVRTMTIPPDCSAVHMLMMGAMPMVVPWKYTPLKERKQDGVTAIPIGTMSPPHKQLSTLSSLQEGRRKGWECWCCSIALRQHGGSLGSGS